jgi:Gamma-glutamyl cyclotransferase, AIG2-like
VEARRVRVFFYGLFMAPDLLRDRGLRPVNPRRASVRGMRLRIGERAALEFDPDGVVYGILVELTHGEIERLYAEPSVSLYRPEAVLAEPDEGEPVAALCFNLPSAPMDQPNLEYLRKLRELATRLGLPAGYVSSIG